MGLLDFIFDKEKAEEKKLLKLKKSLTNMYVQHNERMYIMQQLAEMDTQPALEVLLCRFQESAPNTTNDMNEKEYLYSLIVDMGQSSQVDITGIVTDFLEKSEGNINWPMRILSDLLSFSEMVELVRRLLASCSTDYQRNPEKKQELILRSVEFVDEGIVAELIRLLDDANETVRFLTVESLITLAEKDSEGNLDKQVQPPLQKRLIEEDSLRTVQRLCAKFAESEWKIPNDDQAAIKELLPEAYSLHRKGHIVRRRT